MPTRFGTDFWCLGLILAAVLAGAGPGISEGGLGWSDAPNHTFDGIFILELFKAAPLGHVREWAQQFYLRFPALGIIVYYPPGFAVVEACFFALFGVSVLTARMTVLVFVVGAGWLMYVLGARWFDRPTGLLASLLLITCPHGIFWANDVMLEWPATFWILTAVYCYERDRAAAHARWSVALSAAFVMAFMTKQTAGFIVPVILVHAGLQRRGSDGPLYFAAPARIAGFAVAAVFILVYLWLTRDYSSHVGQLTQPSFDLLRVISWAPEIVGWPLLPVAVLGLLTFFVMPNRGPRGLLMVWFIVWTGISATLTAKEPRYLFFSLPPLMLAAVRFFTRPRAPDEAEPRLRWATDRPRLLMLGLLVLAQAALARAADVGRLPRYDGVVSELAARPDADLVLVDAVRDGQLVFDLYQNEEANKRIIPLRASKVLYARPGRAQWGVQTFVHEPGDIIALLDRYGIRYIVVESKALRTDETDADRPPRVLLRQLMRDDARFKLVQSWPLRCGDPVWHDVELQLFEYPSCPRRSTNTIRLPIPAMNREVEIRLPEAGR